MEARRRGRPKKAARKAETGARVSAILGRDAAAALQRIRQEERISTTAAIERAVVEYTRRVTP